jgi:hypothetical protein
VPTFPADTVTAVLAHMNRDHLGDNLTIVRAFGQPDAASASMTTLDEFAGYWITDSGAELRIPWSVEISERAEIRREIVALHTEAVRRLGQHG